MVEKVKDKLQDISPKVLGLIGEVKKELKKQKDSPVNPKKRAMRYVYLILMIGYFLFVFGYLHIGILMIEKSLNLPQAFGPGLRDMLLRPFAIFPLPNRLFRGAVWMTIIYIVIGSLIYLQDRLRRGYSKQQEVQGDAKWLSDLDRYNMKFTEPFGSVSHDGPNNMILAQDIYMSMDNQKIRRNMNVFVIGGSGSGKSYNFVGPNLMQANCSYVITDPSGGLFKEYGHFFESKGYHVKCFNLDHMERGNHYNPFNYIHSDKDIEILVTTLISNTTPKDKQGGDPFWEKSETALLVALIAYLYHYSSPPLRTFGNVMRLMRAADIDENDSSQKSDLDKIFEEVEQCDKESFALKQYKTFKMGAGKTLKGILISCAVRLQAFDLTDVENLTGSDDLDLDSVGDEKTALFVIIPTGEKTFNFLASMMYSQLFQRLYGYCENIAEFSQLIMDSDNQLVKTFRSDSADGMKKARERAEAFFEAAKKSEIKYNEKYGWYELRTKDGKLVTWRRSQEEAAMALLKIRRGRVMANAEQSNHGQRLPIHTRLMLDEFANIGKIPEFPEKVATIRKYELSVAIILQSLTQMKKMYKDEWGELSGNCDNTIYLGGGADPDTTEWISKLLGKETRIVVNTTFSQNGGSTSLNKQGVELFSPAQLRTMPEDECVIIPKSQYAFKGKKYMSDKHPNRALVKSLPPYYFDAQKSIDLLKDIAGSNLPEKLDEERGPVVVNEEFEKDKEKINSKNRQNAEEAGSNRNQNGESRVSDPTSFREDKNGLASKLDLTSQERLKEAEESMIATTDERWGLEELDYGYAEASS